MGGDVYTKCNTYFSIHLLLLFNISIAKIAMIE